MRQRTDGPAAGRATGRRRARGAGALLGALVLGVLVLGVLALAATPGPAAALTPVVSDPRPRAQLDEQPGAVTLAFARDVDPGVAKMVVTGADGGNVTEGALIVEGTNVTSQLSTDLPRGTYTVHFRVDRPDGQPEGGAFQFSYGPGRFTSVPDRSWSGTAAEPAVLSGSDPNRSEEPETPAPTTATPGIEVTSTPTHPDPEPPATRLASTVRAPRGPATAVTSAVGAEPSDTAGPAGSAGGRTGLVVGVLVLAALVGLAAGWWHTRRRGGPRE